MFASNFFCPLAREGGKKGRREEGSGRGGGEWEGVGEATTSLSFFLLLSSSLLSRKPPQTQRRFCPMPTRSTATARARINWGGTEPGRGSREGKNEAKKEGKKLNLDLFEEKKSISLFSTLCLLHSLHSLSPSPRQRRNGKHSLCSLSTRCAQKNKSHKKEKGEEKNASLSLTVDFGVRVFREQPRFEGFDVRPKF